MLTQPRLLALLTYLSVARPRGFHRRDSLVAMFWPEVGHEQARNALRQVVHRLRRVLGDDVVANRGAEELGLDAARLRCDVVEFEDTLDANRISDALELYRGDLLPGFFLSDAPEFERWLDAERSRLRQRAATAAWRLADSESAEGRGASATQWARRGAAFTPDDEAAQRRFIELLVRLGDHAGAMRAYDALARRLAEDLDIAPSPETRAAIATLQEPTTPTRRALSPGEPSESFAEQFLTVIGASTGPEAPTPAIGAVAPTAAVPRRSWRRAAIPFAALAVVVIATLGTMRLTGRVSAHPAVRTLAVFPFAVRGSADLGYLRDGMVDLLSAKMDGTSGLRSIDPRSVISASARAASEVNTDPKALSAIARRLGASWLITGEIVEIAGRVQISGTLYDVVGQPRSVATANVSGETTTLFQLVDDLAGRILAGVAVGRDTSLTRLSALTTHSLPALKAFLEGEQALRAGQDARAMAAFHEAATLDTTFALALYRLALTATWATGVSSAVNPAVLAASAARYAERLPPLVRDLLAAYSAYKELRADAAERMYRVITDAHPDNVEAWLMLGETWFHYNFWRGRSPQEARAPFERVLALDPSNAHAVVHLARLAARGGDLDQLDSLARQYAMLHSDAERLLEIRALRAYTRNDPAERAAVARDVTKAGDLPVNGVFEAAMVYAQNLDAAVELATTATRSVRDSLVLRYSLMGLSTLPLARGQWDRKVVQRLLGPSTYRDWLLESEALVASDPFFAAPRSRIEALRDSVARGPFRMTPYPSVLAGPDSMFAPEVRNYLLGLLSARLGDFDAANSSVNALAAVTEGGRAEIAKPLARALRAEIFRSRGKFTQALVEIERFPFNPHFVLTTFPHWSTRERFLRAELLRALGREAEALPWYESVGTMYDLPYLAPAHLRTAEIYDRMGNVDAARFHYARFVNLWALANPELQPLVSGARAALGRLGAVESPQTKR